MLQLLNVTVILVTAGFRGDEPAASLADSPLCVVCGTTPYREFRPLERLVTMVGGRSLNSTEPLVSAGSSAARPSGAVLMRNSKIGPLVSIGGVRFGGDDDIQDYGIVTIDLASGNKVNVYSVGSFDRVGRIECVANVVDIDGDSIRDMCYLAPLAMVGERREVGSVVWVSGLNGAFLKRFDGCVEGGRFGSAISVLADGTSETAILAIGSEGGTVFAGGGRVVDGYKTPQILGSIQLVRTDGAVIGEYASPSGVMNFGASVATCQGGEEMDSTIYVAAQYWDDREDAPEQGEQILGCVLERGRVDGPWARLQLNFELGRFVHLLSCNDINNDGIGDVLVIAGSHSNAARRRIVCVAGGSDRVLWNVRMDDLSISFSGDIRPQIVILDSDLKREALAVHGCSVKRDGKAISGTVFFDVSNGKEISVVPDLR